MVGPPLPLLPPLLLLLEQKIDLPAAVQRQGSFPDSPAGRCY